MTVYRIGSTRPVTGHGIAEHPAVDRFRVDPDELRRWTAEVDRSRRAYINRDAQLDAWQRNFEKRLEREGR